MRTLARRLPAALLTLALAALLLACPERTTEQAGPDPRLEAEVERLRLALADQKLGIPGGAAVTIALVDGGELRWVRAFGGAADGGLLDPAASRPVPELAPFLLAVGLERLADEGKVALSDEQRRELAVQSQGDGGAALAAELEKAAGKSWRDYLQQEILGPLGMAKTRLPAGPAPSLEASAEDLVKLMVDLQKSHAGRTFRRLKQAGAQNLLRPLGERGQGPGQGLGLDFGGQGQSSYFLRRGESATEAYLWAGFITSGNGAVIFGPTPAAVDETRKVLADVFHWPALQN